MNRISPDALLTLFQLRKKLTAPKLRLSDSRVLLHRFSRHACRRAGRFGAKVAGLV